jgi:hypothetical protein
MPHPDWEDLCAFFDPDVFATAAVITRRERTVAAVLGIFDDPNAVASLGEYEPDHPTPRFICPEVAVTDVRKGDVVTIEGKAFDLMQEPELDGTGIAALILAEPNVIYTVICDAGL